MYRQLRGFWQKLKGNQGTPPVLTGSLKRNIALLQEQFHHTNDLVTRQFTIGAGLVGAAILYIDGMAGKDVIGMQCIQPLTEHPDRITGNSLTEIESAIFVSNTKKYHEIPRIVQALLSGDAVLLVDQVPTGLILDVKGWETREITEATAETAVRGPREAFVETIRVNTSLVRRKITNANLVFEAFNLGKITRTTVMLAYIKGVAPPELYREVRQRLEQTELDAVLESSYIEEVIDDNPLSPFPSFRYSERPDTVAGHLLEGGVAILVDGTPEVLMAPITLNSLMQTSEDYYYRYPIAFLLRLVRWVALFFGLSVPALYAAVTSFHQELIPTPLLLKIAAGRHGVPYPAFVEILIMEGAFEILREAALRMPRPMGQAISIVGVLVIGDAAVRGGGGQPPDHHYRGFNQYFPVGYSQL